MRAALLLAAALAAGPEWLADGAIRQAFIGETLAGTYNSGVAFVETYAADGGLRYSDPNGVFDGRWVVVNGQFCMVYLDLEGGCFRVHAESANCFLFYSSDFLGRGGRIEDAFIAKGHVKSRPSTCVTGPSV